MSIIYADQGFAIIDELDYYNGLYKSINYKMNPKLFEINGEFQMDSQFRASCSLSNKNRKRKRPTITDETILNVQKLSNKISQIGHDIGYFENVDNLDNNKGARDLAKKVLQKHSCHVFNFPIPSQSIVEMSRQENDLEVLTCGNMTSSWVRNNANSNILKYKDCKFLIPSNSIFHISDVSDINCFSSINDAKFDLIIADPPWFNLSVKRKNVYNTNDDVLDSIDFELITDSNGLLVFWITNRKGLLEELKQYLNAMGFEIIALWTWLKVTRQGLPVCEFNESHKLPFERILIATRSDRVDLYNNLPENFVIASVPMAIHSHKPPLLSILKNFGYDFERPLELFARSLLPNVTSIGFEPLLMQSELVFEPIC